MDESLIPKLCKIARNVVRVACRPGGPLERGEFTMAIARRSISSSLGFSESGLDGLKWKDMVKKEVQRALVSTTSSLRVGT